MTVAKFAERDLPLGAGQEPFVGVSAKNIRAGAVRLTLRVGLCGCGPVGDSIGRLGYSIVTRYPSEAAALDAMDPERLKALSFATLKKDIPRLFVDPHARMVDADGMPDGARVVEVQFGSTFNTMHIPESVAYFASQQVGDVVTTVAMYGSNGFIYPADLAPLVATAVERVRHPIKVLPYMDRQNGAIIDPEGML